MGTSLVTITGEMAPSPEYVSVPEHILYRLPHGFSYAQAALIEAVSIAVHAAKIQGSSQEVPPPLSAPE
jgi:threonine dehydrogenase-like Zn-dependent dehydrogenase